MHKTVLSDNDYPNITKAFKESYTNTTTTQFTKIKMNYKAHLELLEYFKNNIDEIETWFNIISPEKT